MSEPARGEQARHPGKRLARRLAVVAAALAVVVSAAGGLAYWRLDTHLRAARREMELGRYEPARQRLKWLEPFWPDRGEVAYLLGVCEEGSGHPEAALAAWERVPDRSGRAAQAAAARARWEMRRGRLKVAERLLQFSVQGGNGGAREQLVRLLRLEGRNAEARRVLEQDRDRRDPIAAIRELWKLDTDPLPIEAVRKYLEGSGQDASDDDRVWLGKANLAAREGRFDDAERWLQACLKRSPNDPAVWRARLDEAVAAGRLETVVDTLPHLPADQFGDAEVASLRAWLAAQHGDRKAEARALATWVDLDPAALAALGRWAELATERGDSAFAAELRQRQAPIARDQVRYGELLAGDDPSRQAAELAQLADRLGRPFDAGIWHRFAKIQREGGQVPAGPFRMSVPETRMTRDPRTLADVLGERAPLTRSLTPYHSAPTLTLPEFSDDAEAAGLHFTFDNGRSSARQLPETMEGGVALLDFDGDGWLDVYFLQGGPLLPDPTSTAGGDRLFRNQRDGTFRDVTTAAGLPGEPQKPGQGVAVGDFDNDGHPDLFVTRWRSYTLLRNQGDGTFHDVTESAGLGGDRDWPTSAAWADLDDDGDLDLYVCHYVVWDEDRPKRCEDPESHRAFYCTPRTLEARPDHLFRNDGGRFVDVTAEAGIVDHDGRGLGVVAFDADGDGRMDLFVANDMSANFLFHNLGGWKFEEVAQQAGVASNSNGGYQAGMGIACGDVDGDGRLDLAVSNFYGESTSLFHNLGGGIFADHTAASGLAAPSRYRLGFGVCFFDSNNDGYLDLAVANGHVNDGRPQFPWTMPAQFFLGTGHGRLSDLSSHAGRPWLVPRLGRGLAAGDLDNDGHLDLVLVSQNAPVAYLHNRSGRGHHVSLQLEGTRSNRDGVGAFVTVQCGGHRQVAARHGGGSYQSASDGRIHFGLGSHNRVDELTIVWPSGHTDHHRNLPADRQYKLREGSAPVPR